MAQHFHRIILTTLTVQPGQWACDTWGIFGLGSVSGAAMEYKERANEGTSRWKRGECSMVHWDQSSTLVLDTWKELTDKRNGALDPAVKHVGHTDRFEDRRGLGCTQ